MDYIYIFLINEEALYLHEGFLLITHYLLLITLFGNHSTFLARINGISCSVTIPQSISR